MKLTNTNALTLRLLSENKITVSEAELLLEIINGSETGHIGSRSEEKTLGFILCLDLFFKARLEGPFSIF